MSGLVAAFLALAAVGSNAAYAATAEDDLSRCLVKSATAADNEVLVFWVFAAISENPKLAPLVNVSAAQRETFDKQAAALFQRLLLRDCRRESVTALQQDGTIAIAHSFELLGATAGRQMMTDPQVLASMQHMTRYLDQTQWRDFAAEAGATAPAPPPAKPPK
jgi:hypothetical protein